MNIIEQLGGITPARAILDKVPDDTATHYLHGNYYREEEKSKVRYFHGHTGECVQGCEGVGWERYTNGTTNGKYSLNEIKAALVEQDQTNAAGQAEQCRSADIVQEQFNSAGVVTDGTNDKLGQNNIWASVNEGLPPFFVNVEFVLHQKNCNRVIHHGFLCQTEDDTLPAHENSVYNCWESESSGESFDFNDVTFWRYVNMPVPKYKYNPADYHDGKSKYYHCRCKKCGWEGSSKFLGVTHYHDDADIYCSYCNSPDIDTEAELPKGVAL